MYKTAILAIMFAAMLPLGSAFAIQCYDERTTAVMEAISTLDADNAAHFNAVGKPRVRAIEAVTGFDITAKERNKAWGQHPAWQEYLTAACPLPSDALEDAQVRIANLEEFLELERDRCAAQIDLVERELENLAVDPDCRRPACWLPP